MYKKVHIGCPRFHALFFSMPKNDEKKKRVETWKTIFQSQLLDVKKPVCEHYAHN